MNREEKKRKFRDALLNTLYPPSPSPPPPPTRSSLQEHNNDQKPATPLPETFDVDLIPDDYGQQQSQSSSSSENDDKSGPQKLSRAQRKRIRQKKLKEDASRRRNLIGPLILLPPSSSDEDGKSIASVRQNANESQGQALGGSSANQGKMKQRRRAKKMAKEEKLMHPNMENNTQDF